MINSTVIYIKEEEDHKIGLEEELNLQIIQRKEEERRREDNN